MSRPIFYVAVLATLLFFGVLFLWQPEYRDFTELQFMVRLKAEELHNKTNYFAKLQELGVRLEELGSEFAKVESSLPDSRNIPDTVNFIYRAGFESGLLLQFVDIGKTIPLTNDSKILKTEITLSFLGTYPAFRNFLSELQNNARLIAAQTVSFKWSTDDGGGANVFLFNLKVRAHSY